MKTKSILISFKYLLILGIFSLNFTLSLKAQNWEALGPNTFPKGNVNESYSARTAGNGAFCNLAVDPLNAYNLYTIGFTSTGVRRNLQNVGHWEEVNSGFPALPSASALKIDPKFTDHIYCASSEYGIFQTFNKGTTWSATNYNSSIYPRCGALRDIGDICISPDNNSAANATLLVSERDWGWPNGSLVLDYYLNKYKPSNGTLTALNGTFPWIISRGINPTQNHTFHFIKLLSHPDNVNQNTKKYYITVEELNPTTNAHVDYTLWVLSENTLNNTFTWQELTPFFRGVGLSIPPGTIFTNMDIEVLKNTNAKNYIYCSVTYGAGPTIKMLQSVNSGNAWTTCNGSYTDNTYGSMAGFSVSEILDASNHPQTIYYFILGNGGSVHKVDLNGSASNNINLLNTNGSQYNYLGNRIKTTFHCDMRDIEISKNGNNEIIYITNDGGVVFSDDQGAHWDYVNNNDGLNGTYIDAMSVTNDGKKVYTGLHHSSLNIYDSEDPSSNKWVNCWGGDGVNVLVDKYNSDHVLYQYLWFNGNGTIDTYVEEIDMTNLSSTGIPAANGITSLGGITRPMRLFGSNELYVGYSDISAHSKTSSGSWNSYKISNLSSSPMADMYISENKTKMYACYGNQVWGGTLANQFWRNFNANGVNTSPNPSVGGWEDITNKIVVNGSEICRWFAISCIAVDPSNHKRIWAGLNNWTAPCGNSTFKVIKSDDGGDTWSDLSNGAPQFPVNKIIYEQGTNRLFIGTTGGVYYFIDDGTAGNSWHEYNPSVGIKIPKVNVQSLEICYATNELYVGAWGYGVWKTPLECDFVNNVSYTVTSDQTWWGDYKLNKEIHILNGATLTIKGTVYCHEQTQIFVHPGCKLNIDGGKLTNGCDRSKMWYGVSVYGTQGSPQTPANQGYLVMNNGTIENSYNAVTIGDYSNGNSNGGVVQAESSHFINNKRSIQYLWYNIGGNPTQNIGYFNNCDFTCTGPLLSNSGYGTGTFVTLNGVWGVGFHGCTFKNSSAITSGTLTDDKRGTGIYAIDADFVIDAGLALINQQCSQNWGARGRFEGLSKGIEMWYNTSNYKLRVFDADFINVNKGVELHGGRDATIFKSYFLWDDNFPSNYTIYGPPIGVSTTDMDGILIRENTMEYKINSTYLANGLIAGFTGTYTQNGTLIPNYTSRITKNNIHNLMTTPPTEGRGTAHYVTGDNDKLWIKCNDYTALEEDWDIRNSTGGMNATSLPQQGDANNGSKNKFTGTNVPGFTCLANLVFKPRNIYSDISFDYYVKTYPPICFTPNVTLPGAVGTDVTCTNGDYCDVYDWSQQNHADYLRPNIVKKSDPFVISIDSMLRYNSCINYTENNLTEDQIALLDLVYEICMSHRTMQDLNNVEIEKLKQIASNYTDAGNYARAILGMNYGIETHQTIVPVRKQIVDNNTSYKEKGTISLYPNPSTEYLNVVFDLRNTKSTINMVITDMLGKQLINKTMNSSNGMTVFNTLNLANGIYFVNVFDGDEIINSIKFVVQR